MTKPKTYGWRPDLPDHRDWLFTAVKKTPATIDLRPSCSKVEDQGNLGSCTANSIIGALEFLLIKDKIKFEDFSRLFVYFNERSLEGTIDSDSGATLRDGMRAINQWGVCSEKTWPYLISKYATRPTKICYNEALQHKVLSYWRLNVIDEMKTCLSDGFPFVFGFSVYQSFMNITGNGKMSMPTKKDKLLGGHAVMAVGFKETDKTFIIRNSWGTNWGDKGYFYMPYDYLSNRNLSDDFWTVRKGTNL